MRKYGYNINTKRRRFYYLVKNIGTRRYHLINKSKEKLRAYIEELRPKPDISNF